jgi:hypothetical protein
MGECGMCFLLTAPGSKWKWLGLFAVEVVGVFLSTAPSRAMPRSNTGDWTHFCAQLGLVQPSWPFFLATPRGFLRRRLLQHTAQHNTAPTVPSCGKRPCGQGGEELRRCFPEPWASQRPPQPFFTFSRSLAAVSQLHGALARPLGAVDGTEGQMSTDL